MKGDYTAVLLSFVPRQHTDVVGREGWIHAFLPALGKSRVLHIKARGTFYRFIFAPLVVSLV